MPLITKIIATKRPGIIAISSQNSLNHHADLANIFVYINSFSATMLAIVTEKLLNLQDFEQQAEQILPRSIYEYYASGAGDELTLISNRDVYNQFYLKPRVLAANPQRDLTIEILGQTTSSPVLIAPSAYHAMAHQNGEIATAQAARATDSMMILSTMSTCSLPEVVTHNQQRTWLQLYILNDRQATIRLINQAEQHGIKALVLTVDTQTLGLRERDIRNQFQLPNQLRLKLLTDIIPQADLDICAGKQQLFDKSIGWKDIEWLRQHTKLPIILKGILNPLDAKLATEAGVDGLIVSNHGGRQLDTTIPSLLVLPEIRAAVGDNMLLLTDGGIRRGIDILKALALGADAVLIGRPIIWGLAVAGSNGVEQVLRILAAELDNAMALCGFSSIKEIKQHGGDCIERR